MSWDLQDEEVKGLTVNRPMPLTPSLSVVAKCSFEGPRMKFDSNFSIEVSLLRLKGRYVLSIFLILNGFLRLSA